jgi:formylmethanofuran dehydrogenase subunit E
MKRYEVIKVDERDIKNGFCIGQILEGEIKTVDFPKPNEGNREIFEPYNSESFLYSNQVKLKAYPRAIRKTNIKPEDRICSKCNEKIRWGGDYIYAIKKGEYLCPSCENKSKGSDA